MSAQDFFYYEPSMVELTYFNDYELLLSRTADLYNQHNKGSFIRRSHSKFYLDGGEYCVFGSVQESAFLFRVVGESCDLRQGVYDDLCMFLQQAEIDLLNKGVLDGKICGDSSFTIPDGSFTLPDLSRFD